MPGPLEGIRVIDLTTVISGPVCTMILGRSGRRRRQGRAARWRNRPPHRRRRRVHRDVRLRQSRQAFDRTGPEATGGAAGIAPADRPGRRSGAKFSPRNDGPAWSGRTGLRASNPGLIYVSISGVGDTGPYVKKRVYDPVIQSLSGLADLQADQANRTAEHDPHHRRRQNHGGIRGAGDLCGLGGARANRPGPAHPPVDARHDGRLPVARGDDAIHRRRPGKRAPAGAAPRPDLQDPGWLHHRRIALRCRMARTVRRHRPSRTGSTTRASRRPPRDRGTPRNG